MLMYCISFAYSANAKQDNYTAFTVTGETESNLQYSTAQLLKWMSYLVLPDPGGLMEDAEFFFVSSGCRPTVS